MFREASSLVQADRVMAAIIMQLREESQVFGQFELVISVLK